MENEVSTFNLDLNMNFNYNHYLSSIIDYLKKPFKFLRNLLTPNEKTIFINDCLQLDSLMNISIEEIFPNMKIFFHNDINYKDDIFYIFSDIHAMLNYLFKNISSQIHEIALLYVSDSNMLDEFNFNKMKIFIEMSTLILQVLKKFLDNKLNLINNNIKPEEHDLIYADIEKEFHDLELDYYTNIYENDTKEVVKEISKLEFQNVYK